MCLEKIKRYLGVRIEGVNHKQGGPEDTKIFLSSRRVKKQDFEGLLWGHRTGDMPSSFVLGLRPMPRPIITYEKDRGDHGNPKNRVEGNFILG